MRAKLGGITLFTTFPFSERFTEYYGENIETKKIWNFIEIFFH